MKVILIGNYSNFQYHPLDGPDKEISNILKEYGEIECTENYNAFTLENLKVYDICISYVDCWNEKLSQEQTAGIISFVAGGGSLLIIHNGIAFHSNYELAELAGAKFVGHPAYTKLEFSNCKSNVPIMNDIPVFEMEEEPYRFEFSNFTKRDVFLKYIHEGKEYDAGWAIKFGLGKVAYLMPGHDKKSFQNPVYRQIILNSAKWLILSILFIITI